jgi:hypothetical protein
MHNSLTGNKSCDLAVFRRFSSKASTSPIGSTIFKTFKARGLFVFRYGSKIPIYSAENKSVTSWSSMALHQYLRYLSVGPLL